MKLLLVGAFCVALAFAQETAENGTDSKTKSIRRQVPAYAAPYYAGPGPVYAPAPVPQYAAPAPLPVPAAYPVPAPAPVYAPAPAPVYAPAPAPVLAAPPAPLYAPAPQPIPACQPSCVGPATCVSGACQCPQPAIAYSPVVGCQPLPPPPPPPVPVVTGRLIPQALPGAPCEPGVECTGGSVCSMGICLCPPELVQEGTVCVSRTIYGILPPPPPPPPAVVVPAAPIPYAQPVYAPAPVPVPAAIPLGAPCVAAAPTPCAPGAVCDAGVGVCRCGPAYAPVGTSCIRRKLARKEANSEEKVGEQ
uniref:EB domain-containing protein n=1 Tax=Panagrellus redivivus TaxID=6233 RepID=A0A7E4V2A3_PANRE